MKTQLLFATLCLSSLLFQTFGARNRTNRARQLNNDLLEEESNFMTETQETTLVHKNGWETIYLIPHYISSNVRAINYQNVVGNSIDILGAYVIAPIYTVIQNYEYLSLFAKMLVAVGFCVIGTRFFNNRSNNKDTKNDALSKQVLDLTKKVDQLLNKSSVEDITNTSDILAIKEKLDLLTQNFSKTEANIQTLTTNQHKTDEFIHKFKQEILDTQSTILKELYSLKKVVAVKPPAEKTPPKRILTAELPAPGDLNIDTSATTPLLSATLNQYPLSAARKPSTFAKAVIGKSSFEGSSPMKVPEQYEAVSPVSITIPFGNAGLPLSEILSPAKGLKHPFQFQASRMQSSKQKENVIQLGS